MPLPTDFRFSQASLQDFVDCARRFLLRHVRQIVWPAVESEPFLDREYDLALGTAFHRLVWQHLSGLAVERLTRAADHEMDLQRWWASYLAHSPAQLPGLLLPEVTLAAPLAGYRLVAKYDLLALNPDGQAVIVDWKTGAHRPSDETLRARMQTLVYRYLLVQAGADRIGAPIDPARVRMVYWFSEHPDRPADLPYSRERYAADHTYLVGLVQRIASLGDRDFPRSDGERLCRVCSYRSLCGRGEGAGEGEWEDNEAAALVDLALDFGQVAEIEF